VTQPAVAQTEKRASEPAKPEPETTRAAEDRVAALADYARALLKVERLHNELKEAEDPDTALRKLDELSKALSEVRAALWRCRDAGGWKAMGSRRWNGDTPAARGKERLFVRQPELKGAIEHVEKGLCVVRIEANPDDLVVEPGWYFAVHDGRTYKGEAVITDVTGEFAFCRITRSVPGTCIAVGDRAETNVGL